MISEGLVTNCFLNRHLLNLKNMRSTSLLLKIILPLSVLSLSSMAQEEKKSTPNFSIGVHATPTYSNRVLGMPSDYKPSMGFVSGVSGQYNFSPRWALHVELNYERSAFKVIDRNVYADNAATPIGQRLTQTAYKVNNIQLPISMKFNFINKEKVRVYVHAGTFINYVSGYNAVSNYADGSTQHFHGTSRLNRSLGLIVGLGTDITLTQRLHLTLEARATNFNYISYGLFVGLTYQLSK
jgi:hypothetical protein